MSKITDTQWIIQLTNLNQIIQLTKSKPGQHIMLELARLFIMQ
jgi:hypothetical protein